MTTPISYSLQIFLNSPHFSLALPSLLWPLQNCWLFELIKLTKPLIRIHLASLSSPKPLSSETRHQDSPHLYPHTNLRVLLNLGFITKLLLKSHLSPSFTSAPALLFQNLLCSFWNLLCVKTRSGPQILDNLALFTIRSQSFPLLFFEAKQQQISNDLLFALQLNNHLFILASYDYPRSLGESQDLPRTILVPK
jgi:hypothetical protein